MRVLGAGGSPQEASFGISSGPEDLAVKAAGENFVGGSGRD